MLNVRTASAPSSAVPSALSRPTATHISSLKSMPVSSKLIVRTLL